MNSKRYKQDPKSLLLYYQSMLDLSMKTIILIFVTVEVISFSFYFLLYSYQDFNLTNILSAAFIVYFLLVLLVKSNESFFSINKSQSFIFLSLASWLVAEILYGYYNGILQVDPYPSLADIFYFTGYIFFALFLCSLYRSYKIELGVVLSSLITFCLFIFYVLYISVFIFEVYVFTGSVIDLVLLFTYPILDLIITVGALIYFFRERDISLNKSHFSWVFIALFGFFFFIADLIFGFNDIFSLVGEADIFDLFYNLGYICLGVSIIIRMKYTDFYK
ncbi:MAG TPA: hypothetical protein VD815_01285 [Candidatus Saccharimonadales bacterium]|nr:hypothetical protein [Candidatus Saccharimonadales bacterium]